MRMPITYPQSPEPRKPGSTRSIGKSPSSVYSRPKMSDVTEGMDTARMFELFENKAEVQILHSPADDRLAASMYGGAKKKKKKVVKKKKAKNGISGYDFDTLIKDESSSSSTSDYH